MQDILDESLSRLRKIRIRKKRMIAILLVLSLVVSLNVFWGLRQPGLTLAGDADCKIVEHTHDEACQNAETTCELAEHVHSIRCYADVLADVETQLDWQKMFADYPYTGNLQKDLAGIARTQVGYQESTLNFEVGDDGLRRGYTRYGAWYGAPYTDWSAVFVSFCLHYAGADPAETPYNTGAAAMAETWKNLDRFAPRGEYDPSAGDLVFFANNTVGIIAEVQNATGYVIRGDIDNAVCADTIALSDESIVGWGLTEHAAQKNEEIKEDLLQKEQAPAASEVKNEYLLDISKGPAVFIIEGNGAQPQAQGYKLRNARAIIDLLPYLQANGGSYFFTLLDNNNVELPKDENGNYIAEANEDYKLTITLNSPEGFLPGTYQYQIPNGLMVDGGEGTFVLKDGTNVGSWVVTDTGLITLVFNEHMNSRTEITISATLGIHFPVQEDPIDFDGKITVKVEPPAQQKYPTVLNKWGQGGVPGTEKPDPSKIYWRLEIVGNKDSQIPGNILTDRILDGQWSKIHRFTESDIAGGLTFGVSDPNGGWHAWTVAADDPHLIWTDTGWSYKMPTTATCQWCGEITLGNEGWYYYIDYTSTPERTGTAGTFGYENDATIDGAYGYAWVDFTHGEAVGEIAKNGAFVSDAAGGGFLWEIQALIPGRPEDQRAEYSWAISDEMRLIDASGNIIGKVYNDINMATVYATYNGTTIQIPRIQDATEGDMFAWNNAWTVEDGTFSTRTIDLLCRCQCTPETCHWGTCGAYWFKNDAGEIIGTRDFCQCWTVTQDMTITVVYKTTDLSILEAYGPLGYKLSNQTQLYYMSDSTNSVKVDNDVATVTIPKLFEKQLTHDFDGYTANYRITVNEAKLVLTDGSPLHIRDAMSDTLAYIGGSLVITAEDVNGQVTTLNQGTDYTIVYDGTGNQRDDAGKKVHVLDIVIQHPQPVMYTLDYDATLIMPENVTGAIKYSNSAEITLWGEQIKDNAVEKVYADINIAAKNYKVEMFKTCAETGKPLGGATFGLYNAHGGLITTSVTDASGALTFKTNILEGIVLREHILYYMQELRAPPGYRLDDTKHWFCFCDKETDTCTACSEIMEETDAVRIPFDRIGKIHATNELMKYALPATGGPGIYPLILASVICIITPLVYGFIRRRKRERRGVG
ncbi:MAG: hypothetical protein IJB02_03025 [Oscillospiraceae bacterium]|nr:hypothetical protein [Oscillospiraceae bacterium]